MDETRGTVTEFSALIRSVGEGTSLGSFLKDLCAYAVRRLNADAAHIVLEDMLVRRFARGSSEVESLQDDDAASHWIMSKSEALAVEDTESAEHALRLSDDSCRAYLGMPIVGEGRGRGVLYVRSNTKRDFREGIGVLETLAALAALAISQRELLARSDEHHRTMVRFALADPLTNLASQKHFDYMLRREWRRAQAEVSPLALLRLELDGFEVHRGRIGPAQGRQTLLAVARLLDSSLYRPSDLAARLEGDRFAILLPDTDRAGAEAIARRLVSEASALALPHPNQEGRHVTLSIGVAAHEPLNVERLLEAPEDLTNLADAALEQAQTVGGNQVASTP